jgi:hypothetical protein
MPFAKALEKITNLLNFIVMVDDLRKTVTIGRGV